MRPCISSGRQHAASSVAGFVGAADRDLPAAATQCVSPLHVQGQLQASNEHEAAQQHQITALEGQLYTAAQQLQAAQDALRGEQERLQESLQTVSGGQCRLHLSGTPANPACGSPTGLLVGTMSALRRAQQAAAA